MGAQAQINGVTTRSAVVPFGGTVALTNAAPSGTSQKWEVLDYPSDLDGSNPDFATNFAAWSAAGDETYFVNQGSGPFAAVTFKPDVTGTYWLRLTSTEATIVKQTFVVRVAEVHTGEELPAAGERKEDGDRQGYKRRLNLRLKRLGKRMQGYVRVANLSGSSIARGKVVRLTGTVDGHTVSPAVNPGGTAVKAEKLFTIAVADNTAADAATADFAVLDETVANNGTGWAQKYGLFEGKTDVDFTAFTAGNLIYFNNVGAMVNTPPAAGKLVPVGVLLENGSSGTLAVRLAGGQSIPNLAVGTPGGQTATFGTQAGDSGSVTSTASSTKGLLSIGAPTALMIFLESLSAASAGGSIDVINVPASTVTLTGATAMALASYMTIAAPTVTAAGAVVMTTLSTVSINGPPVPAGSATITNPTAFRVQGTWSNTAGTGRAMSNVPTFAPTSGNGAFHVYGAAYTINQTGGASGTTTGLYMNATETAVVGTHNLMDLQVGGSSVLTLVNSGNLTVQKARGGADLVHSISNTSNTATSRAVVQALVAGTSAGDPVFQATVTGSKTWTWGIANGLSSRPWVLSNATALTGGSAGTPQLTVDTIADFSGATAPLLVLGQTASWGWAGIGAVIQGNGGGAVFLGNVNDPGISSNTYWDGSAWRYLATGTALLVQMDGSAAGGAAFAVAPSGSAGAAATLSFPFVVRTTGRLELMGSYTVASASGATWNGIDHLASTLTLSGNTNVTTATGLNLVVFRAPTISAASALTVDTAATVVVVGPPVGGGTGPATLTKAYSYWVQAGTTKLDGGLALGTTPVAGTTLRGDVSATVTSASGAVWNGVDYLGATLTLTGNTHVTTSTGVNMVIFRAPTITSASALTVDHAATVAIAGPPTQGGSTTLTDGLSLWIQSGRLKVGNVAADVNYGVDISDSSFGNIKWGNGTAQGQLSYSGSNVLFGSANAGATLVVVNAAEVARFSTNKNFMLATATDVASTVMRVNAVKTVASAAGALWDGVDFIAATLTLSGATHVTNTTGVNAVVFRAPTISAASALTVDLAATVVITGAPTGGGAGPATVTAGYALWSQSGTIRCDGDLNVGGSLATNATVGFLRAPVMAGTPTGAVSDGAISVDSTGTKLWARVGSAWKSTPLS